MKNYKIHLIRHGMTEGNRLGQYIGSLDIPVCEEGFAELRELKEEYEYPGVGRVYCSPLLRCRQTAKVLYPEQEPVLINDLREIDFGTFEGKNATDLAGDAAFGEWVASGFTGTPPEGEDYGDFTKRCAAGLEQVLKDMMQSDITEAAVIVHGGVIMNLMAAHSMEKRPPHDWLVGNGKGFTILMSAMLWMRGQMFEMTGAMPKGLEDLDNARQWELLKMDIDEDREDA